MNLKINLTHNFHVKNIKVEKYFIFIQKGYSPLNSKLKHSEIWNKFINFQGNCFVEQPINKVKKM